MSTPTPDNTINYPSQRTVATAAPAKKPASALPTGYGALVGVIVQMAEIVLVGYLVVMAIGLGNALAQQWVAPFILVIMAHNSLPPSQWGGGTPNS